MDKRLSHVLESLLAHVDLLNNEVMRLVRSEQFTPSEQTFQMVERLRDSCLCGLQTAQGVERAITRMALLPPPCDETADLHEPL